MSTARGILAAGALAVVLSLSAAAQPNYQGLWWNSPPESEAGWGINFAHQGDVLFATWFTYGTDGKAWWLVLSASRMPDGTYAGAIYETSGPAFSAAAFDPAAVTTTAIGTGTLSFRDADNGAFRYTIRGVEQTKYITRQVFGPVPTCAFSPQQDVVAATNYTDLWWVPAGAESGWGINLAHQGDVIFATWFSYGADRKPTWLAATAPRLADGSYAGKLYRTTGPAFGVQAFDPAQVTRTEVGSVRFTFTSGNAARFSYTVDGVTQSKELTRERFFPAGATQCGDPKRSVGSFSVAAVGDIADCWIVSNGTIAAARTAPLVSASDALVLVLGDAAYINGSPTEYANCFQPTWGAFKDRMRPVPGNHDYYTPGAAGYFGYFGAQAGPAGLGYYSFDHGGWHFIMLNSLVDLKEGSAQYLWLADDLARSRDSLCTLAVMHFPAFNSGNTHGSIAEMLPAFNALQAAGVEIVLAGHEHVYERFAPQRADGTADPARGLRHFTVGTGGALPMAFKTTPLANSEFRASGSFGILRLTLGPGTYNWQFITVDNASPVDSGSGTCHP